MITELCPGCNNVVAGEFNPSSTRKWLTSLAKKGGMKAVLTAAGSVIPGFGNAAGFLAGTAIDIFYGKDIDKLVDYVADQFDDNKIYVFTCPNCERTWSRKEDDVNTEQSSDYESETDEDPLSAALNDKKAEIEACFACAKEYNLLSNQFRHYANLGFELRRDILPELEKILDEVEDDDIADEIIDSESQIDGECQDFFGYITDNCTGSMNSPVTPTKADYQKPFSMEVYGAYPLFYSDSIMLVGVIHAGRVYHGKELVLSEDCVVNVMNIYMFGKKLGEAEAGDVCAIVISDSYKNEYGEECKLEFPDKVFMIGSSTNSNDLPCSEPTAEKDGGLTPGEEEYLAEYKACLEDGGEISKGERRLLEKLRVKLGISEDRAAELEASLNKPQLTEEEMEYLEEYRECLNEGGSISSSERRLLDRLRAKLGISEQRAKELEKL